MFKSRRTDGYFSAIDTFWECYNEIREYDEFKDQEEGRAYYISDISTSSIFLNQKTLNADLSCEENYQRQVMVAEYAAGLWDAVHMSPKEIVEYSRLSQRAFSRAFDVPWQTLNNWYTGRNKMPEHTKLIYILILEIFPFPSETESGIEAVKAYWISRHGDPAKIPSLQETLDKIWCEGETNNG